jgi:hypothetical protein
MAELTPRWQKGGYNLGFGARIALGTKPAARSTSRARLRLCGDRSGDESRVAARGRGADGQIRPHSLSLRELESAVERSASSRSGVPAAGLGI